MILESIVLPLVAPVVLSADELPARLPTIPVGRPFIFTFFDGLGEYIAVFTDTEDRIAAGRRYYNANVRNYNTRIESVPTNMIAGTFKFDENGATMKNIYLMRIENGEFIEDPDVCITPAA